MLLLLLSFTQTMAKVMTDIIAAFSSFTQTMTKVMTDTIAAAFIHTDNG
jgi:hypothetical protein